MIDQKYLELINRDIDDTISSAEKEVLDDYLKMNHEAYSMHQELMEIDNLFDKLPDNDPSDNLKSRILNSIDTNRYTHKRKHSIKDYFYAPLSGPGKRLTVSFALGLITGIIFLSLIFYASFYSNFTEANNVLGTIGLSESQVVQSVKVNTPEITGKIDIIKGANQYAIYVNLKSSGKYTLQVGFDKQYLKIDNLTGNESNNSPYSLILPGKEPQKLLLKIMREDSKLFEREISFKQ